MATCIGGEDRNSNQAGARVLVVEDEPQIRRFLRVALTAHGYQMIEAKSGQEGLAQAATSHPDLVILDLGLPDMDGLQVVQRLREWSTVPIIVLSVRGEDRVKIGALDAGADDYVTKPFSMGELLARIRVALRHTALNAANDPVIVAGDLRIDLVQRRVTRAGQEIKLTPTEYEILKVLAIHRDRVVTHSQILRAVWGPGYQEETHYLRVYMGQLRRKLEPDPARPRYLLTEPRVGYRLISSPSLTDSP
ncbi:MAG: response regulator [Limnochordales bacterium]|nr:response regulator [Limnochordales bacterium]